MASKSESRMFLPIFLLLNAGMFATFCVYTSLPWQVRAVSAVSAATNLWWGIREFANVRREANRSNAAVTT